MIFVYIICTYNLPTWYYVTTSKSRRRRGCVVTNYYSKSCTS